jgi:hypothetical protein
MSRPETYTRKDVKNTVKAANAEKARLVGASNTQKKKSMLRPFGNNNHEVPKAGASGPNSLPRVKGGNLHEFPLSRKGQPAATPGNKGPARVILREDNRGKLRFKGVVAHDQSRPIPPPKTKVLGANDHFEVKGRRK